MVVSAPSCANLTPYSYAAVQQCRSLPAIHFLKVSWPSSQENTLSWHMCLDKPNNMRFFWHKWNQVTNKLSRCWWTETGSVITAPITSLIKDAHLRQYRDKFVWYSFCDRKYSTQCEGYSLLFDLWLSSDLNSFTPKNISKRLFRLGWVFPQACVALQVPTWLRFCCFWSDWIKSQHWTLALHFSGKYALHGRLLRWHLLEEHDA